MGLAAHVARRFGRRGPSDDDLRQVAFLALVKAVDRFEPERNVAFSTFAGRTIEGEIKRHFRDNTWTVSVPRSAKEVHLQLRRATDELTQTLGSSAHRAAAGGAARGGRRCRDRGHRRRFGVLDGQPRRAGAGRGTGLRARDGGSRVRLRRRQQRRRRADQPAASREREIVRLRFYEELTQGEIADRMGMSQMHVSRLLRRSFEQMRRQLDSL